MPKLSDLLAKLRAESSHIDLFGVAIALGLAALYVHGTISLDTVDVLFGVAATALARWAGLKSSESQRKAERDAALKVAELGKALVGSGVTFDKLASPEVLAAVRELVEAGAPAVIDTEADTAPIDVPPEPPSSGPVLGLFLLVLASFTIACSSLAMVDRYAGAIERGAVGLDVVVEDVAADYAKQVEARTQECEAKHLESQSAFERCMAPFDAESRAKVEHALEKLVGAQSTLADVVEAVAALRESIPESVQ